MLDEKHALLRDPLTERIIGAALEVHRRLGPGLLESAYEACLARELSYRDLNFGRQRPIALSYRDVQVDVGYRADFVIENAVLLELKAAERIAPIADAQVLTYMKLLSLRKALLLNFNVALLRDGIRRFVL